MMPDNNHQNTSAGGAPSAYDSPADILNDSALTDTEKRKLLEDWKMDLDSRLYAESEGMSSSEPISPQEEARLAEQEQRVSHALDMLNHKS
tara:strand:- start:500 stop:772 length:273 start_codon:yes stop_codon:yes gene_type:complete